MARTKVLTQEKHYKGNLPPKEVEDLIQKLKYQYENCYTPRDIDGFIIIGGDGLNEEGWELVNQFKKWASERGKVVYYHTSQEMVRMRNTLRNRTENIWEI
ncbi:hypothetical protein QNE95_001393 [Vibrio vulnificus]|uniref:hypothetical protein n=1 Tax=Vibrio TaxID=662 RepID=UPI0010234788|nr:MULTISPECIES: hypothetical protein [Vibrio]EGQ7928381.1 6-phosphofructokinase [Vibrio vulnificus]EGQ7950924.1 6-phosphofructokinase [Vibrio vulnificus]EGQ9282079.1 6-phosphofructokinase [Vibrio vulnificus]EGQ9967845.1 hypothetical protein [Vibrio vulnificus]EGR0231505.1 hypothetical protein [Vibrio vulnificus]